MLVKKFIQDIVEEKNGFSFDQPHRLGETILSVVLPIVRKTYKVRSYITLAEAKDVKIEDTGQIDGVYVKNNESKPLYVSRGEIFRGKTQERAAIHGYIIMPNKGMRIAVRCIHASKGINSGTTMTYGGKVPYDINLNNQSSTWNSVRCYSNTLSGITGSAGTNGPSGDRGISISEIVNCCSTTTLSFDLDGSVGDSNTRMPASDDLVSTIDNMSDNIRDAMKKVPSVKNQVGVAFIKENKIHGLDVYDIPVSWDKIKEDVIEKEGSAFIDDSKDIFTFNPEKAALLVKDILSKSFDEKSIYDKEYRVIEIRYEDLIGEAVIFNQQVIHLSLWNKK